MNEYYVDLHVHIGRSADGKEVKKATSNDLTFFNIAYESRFRKGINVIGVVDCVSPYILKDIDELVNSGQLVEKKGGGMEFRDSQTLILGAEIETHEKPRGSAHSLCFFPTFKQTKQFAKEVSKYIKNIEHFPTMSRLTGQELFDIVDANGGIFIPAHVFTPHKSFYGSCCDSLLEVFDEKSFEKMPAIELGLSADSMMASCMSELDGKSFLSNSDAHSLPKMGREYNVFEMQEPTFDEILMALRGKDGRRVKENFGLNPKLGKYHRSYCLNCDEVISNETPPVLECPKSKKHRVITGVLDRLEQIKDRKDPKMKDRPNYNYQIPLDFIPGVGKKTIDKLIERFGNEMNILHNASFEEISGVVKESIAKNIIAARKGELSIDAGGGGNYGKLEV